MLAQIRKIVYWRIRFRRAAEHADPSPLRLAARGMVDAALEIWDLLFVVVVLAVVIAYLAGGA